MQKSFQYSGETEKKMDSGFIEKNSGKSLGNSRLSELFKKSKIQRNIICQSKFGNFDSEIFETKASSNMNVSKQFSQNSKSSQQTKKTQFSFLKSLNYQNRSLNQNSNFSETAKQQVVSITYEEIGLFPRSFQRVFDRFFKQLFFDVENLVIQEYRFYRYLFLTTVKCLFLLIFIPLSVNFFAKNYLIRPITEYYWNTQNHEIFLNSYQQKRAFTELKKFEEKIYFESLLFIPGGTENKGIFGFSDNQGTNFSLQKLSTSVDHLSEDLPDQGRKIQGKPLLFSQKQKIQPNQEFSEKKISLTKSNPQTKTNEPNLDVSLAFSNSLQKRLQTKIYELAKHYNEESIEAITNFFADVLSFTSLCFLLIRLEIQINITKSFLLEVFFGLDDSKKSLLILFVTDLLVGYHSPNIWELFFQTIFDHYGLPESQTTIFLLVATLPVLLDVLFKYLIFRHLNRASPATVATYHAMIE